MTSGFQPPPAFVQNAFSSQGGQSHSGTSTGLKKNRLVYVAMKMTQFIGK